MLLLLVRVPRPSLHADGLSHRVDDLSLCLLLLQSAFGHADGHDRSYKPMTRSYKPAGSCTPPCRA